jgi:hypothetical protein
MKLTKEDDNQYFLTDTGHKVLCHWCGGDDLNHRVEFFERIKNWNASDWYFREDGMIDTKNTTDEVYLIERISIDTHPQYWV